MIQKKFKLRGILFLALLLVMIGGYFLIKKDPNITGDVVVDEQTRTEIAKRALQKHRLMKAKYAPNESHTIGASYGTVVCNFQVNGLSVLYPRHLIQDNLRGKIGGRTDNYAPEGEFFSDYGKNKLTIDAVAPMHAPRDGKYFFCEGSALGERIHLHVGGKNDPLAYAARSTTQVITFTNEEVLKPEIDYQNAEWIIYKSKGNEDDLEIHHKEKSSFAKGVLPDTTVSTHYYLEKPRGNRPSPIFWRDSEPFEETPENMALLWEAYEELIAAFESQKQSEILKVLDIAFIQSELIIGNPKDLFFTNDRLQKYQRSWDTHGFERSSYNKLEDYQLRIADHKKLFKLVLKKDEKFEPVHFLLAGTDGIYRIYEFNFMMFEGKPRVAFIERKTNEFW